MEKPYVLSKSDFAKLPTTSGVYYFLEQNQPIYIGKAINIKVRVKNHFQQPSYRDNLFIEKVEKISFVETYSEIEALILEANLIKKHQPKFNVVWKDGKNYFYVAITKGAHPIVFVTHQKSNIDTNYIGPFIEGMALKKTLKYLRRVFPFYTTLHHPKNQCTWCHLELCPGPNPDLQKYKKNLRKLVLILQGKRKTVLYALRKEMAIFSKNHQFEEAGKLRDRMYALEKIMAHTKVINDLQHATSNYWDETQKALQSMLHIKNSVSRIECYDISNIQGKNATGSMVVFINGTPDKSQYKKFKIKMKHEPNDIAMLGEVLTRRFSHPEWEYPEVILIDGGIAQLNVGITTKNALLDTQRIKVISIAKGRQELFIEGRKKPIPLKSLPQNIYNLIKYLDDEAHRFAITYHKKLRKKSLLIVFSSIASDHI